MPLNPKQLELLAKALAEVHSHSLAPFYSAGSAPEFWASLPEVAANNDAVDRQFFRSIALYIGESMVTAAVEKVRSA